MNVKIYGRFMGLFIMRGCRIERSAYILETDVAVRHVLEMIVRVITRDIGGRDLVQFCAPMHHHVAVNSPIAGRNLLLKNAYGKPLPATLLLFPPPPCPAKLSQ